MLGLLAVFCTQAIHASSFTTSDPIRKHGSLSGQSSQRKMVAMNPDLLLDQPRNRFLPRSRVEHFPEISSENTVTTITPPKVVEKQEEKVKAPLSKIDIGTFGVHFCAAVTMTLPVMIVPMMDAELAAAGMSLARGASLAATMACMAPMGNGIGKLVNGMVCQQLGGSKSSKLYFVGSFLASLALASISLFPTGGSLLSNFLTTDFLGYMVGSIEFCASIQWTVCSLFLSQYYRSQPALFARGITILALSSTGGQIIAKVLGAFLLQFVHWRQVARLSVLTALTGFCMSIWTSRNMAKAMNRAKEDEELLMASQKAFKNSSPEPPAVSAKQAAKKVFGSPVFWGIGLAHVSGYLTRTSDRILGSFLQEITSLSPQICGGLTAFMTVGFLYGLVTTSRKFHQQSAVEPKLRLLKNGYKRYLLSACGLIASAAFGKQWHPYLSASIITLCASIMASSIAFPFFQVPNMVSSVYFGDVKPVALSLIDGTGIVMTAPIWRIFNGLLLPNVGWTLSWSAVATIVCLCGALLMRTMPGVLELQKKQQEADFRP